MASTPVQPHQRIHYLDVIRGFAITGVLIAYVFWNLGNAPADSYTSIDRALDETASYLIDSKCYTLLACLFAVGFVLHMNKAGNRKRSLYTYRRRLAGLLIIGLLHALLLRNGDILVPYALLMLPVTVLYASSNRTILWLMVFVFFLQIFLTPLWQALHLPLPQRPEADNGFYWTDTLHWVGYWYTSAIFFWESTLFLLLAGLLIGRAFIQEKMRLSGRQLGLIALAGWYGGLVGHANLWGQFI